MRTDKKVAKYLNSPESEIYHKSDVLYGIYQAKRAITQQDCCILVEGYTDVISMHQSGLKMWLPLPAPPHRRTNSPDQPFYKECNRHL